MKLHHYTLGLLVLLATVFLGCESHLDRMENRLVGNWSFEKAVFRKHLSFKSEDLLDNYESMSLTLTSNNRAVLSGNPVLGHYEGTWDLRSVTNNQGEQVVNNNRLLIFLNDTASDQEINFVWDNANISNRRISASENVTNGVFRYRLRKK